MDFEEIRRNVAIEHNVLLTQDDPILVTVSLSKYMLKQYADEVNGKYLDANRQLTVFLEEQIEQSKQTAGQIITDSANYIDERVKLAVKEALAQATVEMHSLTQAGKSTLKDTFSMQQSNVIKSVTEATNNSNSVLKDYLASRVMIALAYLTILHVITIGIIWILLSH